MPPHKKDVLSFGIFELDLTAGEIRKAGVRIKLRPQAFRVLALLASRSGSVVSREEIQKEIWNDQTTVDFERGLNFCIRQIRAALGDQADTPRFIETIPRRGYRFLVQATGAEGRAPAEEAPRDSAQPSRRMLTVAVAVVVLFLAGGSAWFLLRKRNPRLWVPVPLTSYPGLERSPALSPSGDRVAFTWDGERQDNVDIYVKSLDQDAPIRLTSTPAEELSPTWSPDGQTLAFIRRSAGERGELLLIPASGGAERKLIEIVCDFRQRLCAPAWSRDGRWIAVSDRQSDLAAERLTLVSAETGVSRQLTIAPEGFSGDFSPSFSPNGRSLAFTRLQGYAAGEVHVLPLSVDLAPAADPRSLTNGKRWARNPIWTPNGDHLLYVFREGPGNPDELRLIRVGSGENNRILLLEDHISELSLGRHLVYSREAEENDIWCADIGSTGDAAAPARPLISSTRDESFPHYSPDGKKIAFVSNRSGSREIWIAEADGSKPVQLTFFGGPLVGPMDWSPDGRWLTFHSRRDGQADIFAMPSTGGAAKRLTTDHSDDLVPTYSRDGQHIYFTSWRSGSRQIWKMSADGGNATQITQSGGYLARESPDRKRIFYCHLSPEQGIWSVSVAGGDETRITGPYSPRLCGLAVNADGLYYTAASGDQPWQSIQYVNLAGRESRPVIWSDRPLGYLSLDISPDGRRVVYSRTDRSQSDLMLVRDFQAP